MKIQPKDESVDSYVNRYLVVRRINKNGIYS